MQSLDGSIGADPESLHVVGPIDCMSLAIHSWLEADGRRHLNMRALQLNGKARRFLGGPS
jgi:hypothetical protein